MKYRKLFIFVSFVCFLITAGLIAIIIFDLTGFHPISSAMLLFVCTVLLSMLLVDAFCFILLQSLYEDWKWRNLNRHDKWKR